MAHIPISFDELSRIFDGANPVVLPDREIGVLVQVRREKPECGVRVAEEAELRWIDVDSFQHDGNGAFMVFRPADPLTVPLHPEGPGE
jgi:hypothetical protein